MLSCNVECGQLTGEFGIIGAMVVVSSLYAFIILLWAFFAGHAKDSSVRLLASS